MKKINLLIFVFLFFPTIIHANCSYESQKDLNELATHVEYTFEYSKDIYFFNVTLNNVPSELKILYNSKVMAANNNKVFLQNVKKGGNYKIQIFSSETSNCPNVYIREVYLDLPVYNLFSETKECKKYSEFKFCSQFLTRTLSESEFVQELNSYIATLETSKFIQEKETEKKDNFIKKNFSLINIFLLITGVLFLFCIFILIIKTIKVKKI